jgi:hypothetical protein
MVISCAHFCARSFCFQAIISDGAYARHENFRVAHASREIDLRPTKQAFFESAACFKTYA